MATEIPSVDLLYAEARQQFEAVYNSKAQYVGIAPGRVNLIGEHTDYNDGFVLPIALPSMITIVIGSKHDNVECSVTTLATGVFGSRADAADGGDSANDIRNRSASFRLNEISPNAKPPKHLQWTNYFKGVIYYYSRALEAQASAAAGNVGQTACLIPNFNALILTSVPIGGGLSSSAALEVATYCFLHALCSSGGTSGQALAFSPMQVAKLCQQAEHNFAHMPCGIMDQAIAVHARENFAMLLDCRSGDIHQQPFEIVPHQLVLLVTDSNVKHELTGSEYAQRRATCAQAAHVLGFPGLRDATVGDVERRLGGGSGEGSSLVYQRARHVVTEIARTREAGEHLKRGEFRKFGKLMNQSHVSLRDDYEVSCKEVDVLVAAAQKLMIHSSPKKVDGFDAEGVVLGSRMTGGGFGGCLVTLLRKDGVDRVIEAMNKVAYKKPTHYVLERAGKGCSYGVVKPEFGGGLGDLTPLN